MESFVSAFSKFVLGILNGFDRLVFRGHLRTLAYRAGMEAFLNANDVLRKDFKEHCLAQTEKVLQASFAEAKRLGRPIEYLATTNFSGWRIAPVPSNYSISSCRCTGPSF